MTNFYSEDHTPRCAEEDVNPDWWLDRDREYDQDIEGYEEMTRAERAGARTKVVCGDLAAEREDQLRAKFYCYQCPLLTTCRDLGWQEGYHVWGGLDPRERYQILKDGNYGPILWVPQRSNSMQNPIVQRFLKGESVDAISGDTGVTRGTIFNLLRGALAILRGEREVEACSRTKLPALPKGMSRELYRRGRAEWSLSERESA